MSENQAILCKSESIITVSNLNYSESIGPIMMIQNSELALENSLVSNIE